MKIEKVLRNIFQIILADKILNENYVIQEETDMAKFFFKIISLKFSLKFEGETTKNSMKVLK